MGLKSDRRKTESAIWNATHKDYRGRVIGKRSVLIMHKDKTTLVPLSSLTNKELAELAIKMGVV
jgi:hypothetical protein